MQIFVHHTYEKNTHSMLKAHAFKFLSSSSGPQFIIRIWCFPIMYWKVSGWKLCLSGQKFLHTHKTLAKCTTSIALSFDSLLLRGISAGPCFRPTLGCAWQRVCLRCRAHRQKQGLALTSCNNRLSNERAMTTSKQLMSEKPSTP